MSYIIHFPFFSYLQSNPANRSHSKVICFFKDAFQKITETFGGVDIYCNNAGIMNEMEWQKTISVNLVRERDLFCQPDVAQHGGVLQVSAVSGNYLALKHMSRLNGGRGGVIVNIASMAGEDEVVTQRSSSVGGRLKPFTLQVSVLCHRVLFTPPPSTDWLASLELWR